MAQSGKLQSDRVAVQNSLEEVNELIYERGWSDGLPVVPPTEERVLAMLNAVDRDPQEVLGLIPPAWAEATIEKIAINAVMAGA
ncbi:MAG: thioredoxin, partial [Chloroflexi bacterium]|nr:thioredoxin [Chloroflexota bacterium]